MANKKEANLKRKRIKEIAVIGFFFLSARRILLLVTAFISNILLARNLSPFDFGTYGVMVFFVTIISSLNDLGLNAATIQTKKNLKQNEKNTIFTVQIFASLILMTIFLVIFPTIMKDFYHLKTNIFPAMTAMLLGMMFNVLSLFPMSYLERNLEFQKISFIEVSSTILYQITAVAFSFLHYGVWALVNGYIVLNLTQVILVWPFSKFKPKINFKFKNVKRFLKFGISYQLSSIINLIKDSVTPLFVGSFVGITSVGLLDWAKNVVTIPNLITESFGRVAFSTYSKFQHDKEYLERIIENSIRLVTFVTFPITLYLVVFGRDMIHIFYTDKWISALPAVYLFSLGAFFTGIATPLYYGILALGESKTIFKMSMLLLLLEWGLGVPLIIAYGFLGIAIAAGPISWIFMVIYYFVLKHHSVNVNVINAIMMNLLISLVTFLLILLIKGPTNENIINFIYTSVTCVLFYLFASYLFNSETIEMLKRLLLRREIKSYE